MDRTLMMLVILLIYTIYVTIKHRSAWKKLTNSQIIGVIVTFVGMTAVGMALLYFGFRTMQMAHISDMISVVGQYIYAIIIVGFSILTFNIIISRITHNVLPVQNQQKKS